MSDGPHYSLDAQKWWKNAAKAADTPAYSEQEVCDAAKEAVIEDCKNENVSQAVAAIKDALNEGANLFDQNPADLLEPVKSQFAGYELAIWSIEYAQEALRNGLSDLEALDRGLEDALNERCDRETRAIDEHYLRHISGSNRLFGRIEQAIDNLPMELIVRGITGNNPTATQYRSKKKDGIDDGPGAYQ